MLPAIVLMQTEIDLNKRTPFRPLRFANEVHSSFLRCAIRFKRIALDARANDILPRRRTAAIARNNVIQIQVLPVTGLAAELAGILVAFENVMACEFDFLLGQTVIDEQQDHARHADAEGNRVDGFRVR